jgi:hypothetical protein
MYEAKRPNSRYCGDTCRKRAQRAPKVAKPAESVVISDGLAVAATRELEAAGRLDTALGQTAVVLARRIESPMETGASVASMTKQLRETLAEALKGADVAEDPLDMLRERRDRKRHTG